MKTNQNLKSGIREPKRLWHAALAGLALTAAIVTAQAQPTYLNTFNTSSSPFRFDYGATTPAANHAVTFAPGPTYDAGGSAASGSAKLAWTFNYVADGAGGATFTADIVFPATNVVGYTLSFDIMVDPSSTPGLLGDY